MLTSGDIHHLGNKQFWTPSTLDSDEVNCHSQQIAFGFATRLQTGWAGERIILVKKALLLVTMGIALLSVTPAWGYYHYYRHWPNNEWTGSANDCDWSVAVDDQSNNCIIQFSSNDKANIVIPSVVYCANGICSTIPLDGFSHVVVTEIPSDAFRGLTKVQEVDIPNTIVRIGTEAFRGCTGLTSIHIPDSVMAIGWGPFSGCGNLMDIRMPSWLWEEGGVLADCGIKDVSIPEGVSRIGDCLFSGCLDLEKVSFPDSLTSIGCSAFEGCASLSQVRIPASVNQIGAYAFAGAENLKKIEFNGLPPRVVGYDGNITDELLCQESWNPDDVIWAVYPQEYEVEWQEAWFEAMVATGGGLGMVSYPNGRR